MGSAVTPYGRRWRKRRRAFLRQHPTCRHCARRGVLAVANQVDHVVPHRGNPDLMWSEDNWQALCHACHSHKTARELVGAAPKAGVDADGLPIGDGG